ncbi:MAG: MBL fold metallo-hydrolase [Anaerolineae bacterium]|nr:MBL fold metallo-hydrolase [Anaerolineae bacterium]
MIQVEQVGPGQEVVKLRLARSFFGRSAYFTAAYWVDGLLIDTGCAHTARQLVSIAKGWRVERVVNTHSHEDHIGANAAIQETFHCPILAHPEALPVLHNPRLQRLQPYRRLFWGWPRPCRAEAVGEWVETPHHRLQVLPTPGHSPDHVCFFEPDRGWLFSGDAYIGGRDRALRAGYNIHDVIASLKKLAGLPVETIFSGSGSVHTQAAQLLRDKIKYLEELGARIRSLHDQGVPRRRIGRQLFGRELPIAYITLGHFSSRHLVDSYLAPPGELSVENSPGVM